MSLLDQLEFFERYIRIFQEEAPTIRSMVVQDDDDYRFELKHTGPVSNNYTRKTYEFSITLLVNRGYSEYYLRPNIKSQNSDINDMKKRALIEEALDALRRHGDWYPLTYIQPKESLPVIKRNLAVASTSGEADKKRKKLIAIVKPFNKPPDNLWSDSD